MIDFDTLYMGHTNTHGEEMRVDEIRMGETFNSVVGLPEPSEGKIPEPATLGALGLAVAGLGGYVKRRRRL